MPNDFIMVSKHVGWDSVVGTATCYRLGGLRNESRLGQDFLHTSILKNMKLNAQILDIL
jgi:hypothetical protein